MFNRTDLLTKAAASLDIDEACATIQNAIGQTDGGLAGIFFSDDDLVTAYETEDSIDARVSILSEYLDLELAHTTKISNLPLSGFDTDQAIAVVWAALEQLDLDDDDSDQLNTAMAWITEALEA